MKTVTQTLTLTAGVPFDMPLGGPIVYYRSAKNHYKIKFNMPEDVPAGYAIKVLAYGNIVLYGTVYVDF